MERDTSFAVYAVLKLLKEGKNEGQVGHPLYSNGVEVALICVECSRLKR